MEIEPRSSLEGAVDKEELHLDEEMDMETDCDVALTGASVLELGVLAASE